MLFLRAKEFIKYHLINNIVSNLLLIIHIAVILSVSIFLYSKTVKADESFVTGTFANIITVKKINNRIFDLKKNLITKKLRDLYLELMES